MAKFFIQVFCVFLTFFTAVLYSEDQINASIPECSDFYVLTIPKSGSFLIQRALNLLTGKIYNNPSNAFPQMNPFRFFEEDESVYIEESSLENFFFEQQQKNQFVMAHFNFAELALLFSKKNPQYKKIVHIRDLRDVCVSWAHFLVDHIEREIGPSTMDQRLMYIITLGNQTTIVPLLNIYKNAVKAIEWLHENGVIISRFEELVGSCGGGTQEAQENLIMKIANHLNIVITDSELHKITEQLYGRYWNTPTFREGKIGSWKKHFNDAHIAAFEKHLGEIQLALGYDLDWTR